jgi:hypothetical protein
MLKTLSTLLVLFVSINSYAAPKYVGVWCQKFSDFNEYFIFDSENKVEMLSIGVEAGEVMSRKGYVSKGANGFRIFLDKENTDIGVVDYKKNLAGQLVLIFEGGARQRYNKCDDPRTK